MGCIVHGILQARILEWVPFPFFRGIFPTQRSNPCLPHSRWILHQLSHKGGPIHDYWNSKNFKTESVDEAIEQLNLSSCGSENVKQNKNFGKQFDSLLKF